MLAGFGLMILLLLMAGITGRAALSSVATQIATSLAASRKEVQLTSRLAASVAQGLAAGARYLTARDSATRQAYARHLAAAHSARQELTTSPGMSQNEL